MIYKTDVKLVAESFLKKALCKYPHTLDVLLSHPRLPEWYEILALELTKLEAEAIMLNQNFNHTKLIQHWVTGYVEHALAPNKDKHLREVASTIPDQVDVE